MTEEELKEHSKEIDSLYEYRKGTGKIQGSIPYPGRKPPEYLQG